MQPIPPVKHQYLLLDALRGLAALFVVIWHTSLYWSPLPFQHTYLAVDIFFVLSGFVIASAYKEKLRSRTLSIRGFLVTRLVRLYPMYFFGFLLGAIAFMLGAFDNSQHPLLEFFCAILMLPAGITAAGHTLFLFNLPSWSLFYELVANLFVALIYRFGHTQLLPAVVLVLGAGLTAITIYKGGIDIGPFGGYKNVIIASIRSVFGIFMGLWLNHIHRQHTIRIPVVWGWLALVILVLLLSLPSLQPWDVWVDVAATVFIIPTCVFLLASIRPNLPRATQTIATFLGDTSYPLYAIHYPLMLIGLAVWPETIKHFKNYSGLILLVLLFALSFGLFKWFETPARRWLSAQTKGLRR
ncbi:MAG TPA: acyltransferase [Cellvibrionaceae bacterium]|nr:acyltransferase [Cellvibrionaceae bacterium]HMW49621.1 acyltransferase [Cellvibrionaceae bacterium]HMW72849.1 acyltransferase [Cellvibrionaceae bacterium]HMY39033.1 acyltransferase [Marinagarivorans sp.]HNG59758.1 acyltransferase [Cellvibrionaceae bacterium]